MSAALHPTSETTATATHGTPRATPSDHSSARGQARVRTSSARAPVADAPARAPARAPTRGGVAHLTATQLRQLAAELQGDRARLERRLAREQDVRGAGDSPTDAGDHARAATTERLAATVAAIRRLEEGRYGRCASCQAAIPFGRLFVMPDAQHCLTCGPRGGGTA